MGSVGLPQVGQTANLDAQKAANLGDAQKAAVDTLNQQAAPAAELRAAFVPLRDMVCTAQSEASCGRFQIWQHQNAASNTCKPCVECSRLIVACTRIHHTVKA